MALPSFLELHPAGLILKIKLQPRASREAIGKEQNGEVRISVTAPPADSAANEALLKLLAKKLDCPRRCLELLKGHTSRHKRVLLVGIDPELVVKSLTK